jgi:hypothetical protein
LIAIPTHCRLLALAAAIIFAGVASQSQSKASPAAKPSTASPDTQIYRNSTYGFRYQVPFGWVERSKQMQEGNGDSKGEVLLAVFERPPEAAGDTVNSAVVIASESAESYPGLKKAEDYLGPLTELATASGFQAEGDPSVVEVDSRELVRADFNKQIGAKKSDGDASEGQLTMRQTTLILLAHRRIVSFTFIAGSEDELDKLVNNLRFGVARPAAH